NLLYTNKKTLLKFTSNYLLKIVNKDNILKLYSFKVNIEIVKATNSNSSVYNYFIDFLKIAKAT
ncbi:hypothetical protein GQ607_017944, partial [Colletotrichum asianum]